MGGGGGGPVRFHGSHARESGAAVGRSHSARPHGARVGSAPIPFPLRLDSVSLQSEIGSKGRRVSDPNSELASKSELASNILAA